MTAYPLNSCETSPALHGIGGGLFVFARTGQDMTFVHSSWDEGIEPWRYNLPHAEYKGPVVAHTVFDRTLLRAGETLHMKHLIRKHTMTGFSFLKEADLPGIVLIRHIGSEQRYEFPLKWDGKGVSETEWTIPKDSKLGHYRVSLLKKAASRPISRTAAGGYARGDEEYFSPDGWEAGSFRVEEFRVPLMKAMIQPPKDPLVNAKEAEVDLFLTYLSGGGAGNAPVKLRSQIQPRYVHFEDYGEFVFANGEVKEGVTRRSRYEEAEQPDAARKPKLFTSELSLDRNGGLRTKIPDLPSVSQPHDVAVEMEFRDPNGEVQTISQRIPLWPSRLIVGIKPDSWALSKDSFKFQIVILDLSGKPVQDREVKVDLYQRNSYSHRKRLVGGVLFLRTRIRDEKARADLRREDGRPRASPLRGDVSCVGKRHPSGEGGRRCGECGPDV
jgi:alpha-2-macroglobulin